MNMTLPIYVLDDLSLFINFISGQNFFTKWQIKNGLIDRISNYNNQGKSRLNMNY